MATQTGTQRRKSFVVFGLILLIALFAGIATFVFLTRINNTIPVFYVKNPGGLSRYHVITESDIGVTNVQADTLHTMGGDRYQNVFLYDSTAKDGKGGESAIVGNYPMFEREYGDLVLRNAIVGVGKGDYIAGLIQQPGSKLLTFQVPMVNALAGQLVPGDYIDIMSYDDATKTTQKILGSVQVVDIKYGSNPFAAASSTTANATTADAAGTTGSSATGSTAASATVSRNPLDNTVNPALGDRAIVIIQVPGSLVSGITRYLLASDSLYVVATLSPEVLSGSSVSPVTTDTVAPSTDTSTSTPSTTTTP